MAETNYPPVGENAAKWIRENPNRAADFNLKYGEGAAERILNPQPVEQSSMFDNALEAVANAAAYVAEGAQDVGKGVIEGALGAVRETGQFIDEADTAASQFMDENLGGSTFYLNTDKTIPISFGTQEEANQTQIDQGRVPTRLTETADQLRVFDENRDTLAGSFTQGTTQFLVGMLGAGKLLKLKTGTVKGAAVAGFASDAVAFDPDDANLVRVLDENFGIGADVITQALANNEDDATFEKRLKNGAVGTAIGLPIDIGMAVFRSFRLRQKAQAEINETGTISEATQNEVDEIEATIESFAQLQKRGVKPKGKFTDDKAMFLTEDGMVFDTTSGLRLRDVEASLLNKDAPVKFEEPQAAPAKPEIGDATDAIPTPKVEADGPDPIVAQANVDKAPPRRRPFKKAKLVNAIEEVRKNPEKLMEIDEMVNDRFIMNPKYFEGPRDPEAVLTATAKELEAQGLFKAAGLTGTDSFEAHASRTTTMLAEELNVSEKNFRANLRRVAKTAEEQVQWMTAGKIEMTRIIRSIEDTAAQIDEAKANGQNTAPLYEQYLELAERHADIQLSVQGIRTATGRALNLNKLEINPQVSDAALSKLEELGGEGIGGAKVDQLIAQFRSAKTTKQRNKILQGQSSFSHKFFGVAGETFINGILSSPVAHMLNLGASKINLHVRPALRLIGARDKATRKEAMLNELYVWTSLFESLKLFDFAQGMRLNDNSALVSSMRSFVKGSSELDQTDKILSSAEGRQLSSENLGLKDTIFQDLVDGAGLITTMTSRVLASEDQFFKHIAYRAKVKAAVHMDALEMGQKHFEELGYTGTEAEMRKQYMKDMIDESINTKETLTERYEQLVREGRAIDDPEMQAAYIKRNLGSYNNASEYAQEALEEARQVTFTTPLGKNSMMYGLNKWVIAQPALRQIVPFVQTPTNVLRENFERIPVVNKFMSSMRLAMNSPDPNEAALARGKFAYGWGMAMAALYLAYNDKLTGSGPSYAYNPKLAKQWNDSPDWQPNSLVIHRDDGSVEFRDLSKLLPHFGAFTMVGQAMEYFKRGQLTDDEASLWMGGLVAMFASQVTMQSSLSGVSDFMRIASGDAAPWEVERFFSQRTAAMIPYSGLSYYMNREMDGLMRDVSDFDELIKSRVWSPVLNIAGVEREAPVQYDWLTGNPKNSPDYVYGFVKSKVINIPESKVAAVSEQLRMIDKPLSAPDRREFGKELSPEIFQEMNRLTGTVKDRNGRTLIEAMYDVIQSPIFDKEGKRQPYGVSDFRRSLLNNELNKFKGLALGELIKKLPHLEDTLRKDAEVEAELLQGNMPQNYERLDERLEFKLD